MWARTYPRDWTPHNNLAVLYGDIGEYEKQLESARRSVELQDDHVFPHGNLAGAFASLGRFDEAKAVMDQAMARGLDTHQYHWFLFSVGAATGDEQLMAAQEEWHRGKPTEAILWLQKAGVAGQRGKRRDVMDSLDRMGSLAKGFGMQGLVDSMAQWRAWSELTFGDYVRARGHLDDLVLEDRDSGALANIAGLLATLGEVERAQTLLDQIVEENPSSTWVQSFDAPRLRAMLAMAAGRPEEAVDELRKVRFERSDTDIPYEKGEALLAAGRAEEALVEFQKVIDWVGVDEVSPRKSLARLQIARAHMETGDLEAARNAYLDFLELWAEADEDVPVLQQARSEYEALQSQTQ
jgi:tetratricopeptide (TPR) repeat protein